jgi:hypothetical protein
MHVNGFEDGRYIRYGAPNAFGSGRNLPEFVPTHVMLNAPRIGGHENESSGFLGQPQFWKMRKVDGSIGLNADSLLSI